MKTNFNTNETTRDAIKLHEKEIASRRCFKYLRFIFWSSRDIRQYVNGERSLVMGITWSRCALKLEGKFYWMYIRLSLLYG